MRRIEILAVGKHPEIMQTVLRLINSHAEWNGSLASSVAETLEKSRITAFDVLLGTGLNEEEMRQLQAHFTVPVVRHYGGGSGLLYAEIYQALASEKLIHQ